MNKKEILKKSRKDFKNQNLPEIEVFKKMSVFTLVTVTIIAAVIILAEKHIYGEYNIGLMTVVLSVPFIMSLYMCFKSTQKKHIAIVSTVFYALWFGFAAFCEITSLIDHKG